MEIKMPDENEVADFKVKALDPKNQQSIDKMVTSFYRTEATLLAIASRIAETQSTAVRECLAMRIHPMSVSIGAYSKTEYAEHEEGFIVYMGQAMAAANEAAALVAAAHAQLTRMLCNKKIINDDGGGK
jgi:vacuolar-type H+-ATPase subunit F/Vma7